MTKLTTERLERKIKNCIEIEDCQVMLPLSAAEELLAFREAAKNPVAFVDERGGAAGGICWAKSGKRELPHGTELYAAPVLPKQPELMSIGELLHRLEEQTGEKWVEESGQSVTPDEINSAPDYVKALTKEGAYIYGWNECRAAAQPVIPEQPEFYTKIDRFLPECLKPGDISGERRNSRITELMGWFDRYYSGKANPKWLKPHVAELCYYILTVPQLSAQPVSEPYKLPSGWKLVPIEPTSKMIVAAMGMFTAEELAEVWGDMIEAAPTQESE